MIQANIRELKAHLSEYIRQVEAGETVTISIRNRPVARIVPIALNSGMKDLALEAGIAWNGGKPRGLPGGETMPAGVCVSDWVIEDRR